MHLILKSTSQEIQYKTDRSLEITALPSLGEVTLWPSPPSTEMLAGVYLTASDLMKLFKKIFLVRGEMVQRDPHIICKHLCDPCGDDEPGPRQA